MHKTKFSMDLSKFNSLRKNIPDLYYIVLNHLISIQKPYGATLVKDFKNNFKNIHLL